MAALSSSSAKSPGAAPVPFIDLAAQQARIRPAIDKAIARVLDHGQYIMGPEVGELERRLAAFTGARHVVSCASGTDALLMILMAHGIGAGDAVVCPAFTYTATPESIALLGATPVFCEVRADTFNVDVMSLPRAIETAHAQGLNPRALMVVDLFGQCADYDAIQKVCDTHGVMIIADAAQSFGASCHGRNVGTLGAATATSFFPAKPLGCYGDGGAIFTDDDHIADVLRSIRLHGKGDEKYDIVRIGINGRLDTLQAAILLAKLDIFADEIAARQRIADRYTSALKYAAIVPYVPEGLQSVWAQYTLQVPAAKRDGIMKQLAAAGIPTMVYYPRGVHQQTAYRSYPIAGNGVPVAERLPLEVLSLPMHPYLDEAVQDRIIAAVTDALG